MPKQSGDRGYIDQGRFTVNEPMPRPWRIAHRMSRSWPAETEPVTYIRPAEVRTLNLSSRASDTVASISHFAHTCGLSNGFGRGGANVIEQ